MAQQNSRPWLWIALGFFVTAKVWVVSLVKQEWRPIADEAVIAEIAAGITQGKFPWLGMRSTGFSELPGLQLYHPGPIQFYLLSLAQGITNLHPIGLLTAGALLYFFLVMLGLRGAWQAAKWWGLIPATVTFAALAFASQGAMIQILNTQPARVAIPAAVMTAWAVACGRKNALYPFIFAASVAAQVHVSALPVVLIVLATLIFLWWWNGVPVPDKSTLVFSGLLFVVLWIGPLLDIVLNNPSNLGEFLRYITLESSDDRTPPPFRGSSGYYLLWTVPIALFTSWLITSRSSERVKPGLANSLAVGLQLAAPVILFISYQVATQASFGRRTQAMFSAGVGYFMVSLTILTLAAWIYQAAHESESAPLKQLTVGIGLLVLTTALSTRTELKTEALIMLAVVVLVSSLGVASRTLAINTLSLSRLAIVGLSLSMGLIWVVGIVDPQKSHKGSLESNPDAIRLTDEITSWVLETSSELPVEIRSSRNWNIGLYLAPTLNYELITKKRDSHFVHPWAFEKDHERPGINVPDGERIVLVLESPTGLENATKDLDGEELRRETFETKILNDGEIIEVLMLHIR